MPLWLGFARLLRAQGDLLQDQECYERILKRWKTTEDTLTIMPLLLDGIVFSSETGDMPNARLWLLELQAVMRMTDNPVGAAALLEARGVLKAAEGSLEEVIPLLRQAVEAWGNIQWRYQHTLASRRQVESLLVWARKYSPHRAATQAARAEAEDLLDIALAVYEDLQVPADREAIHALRINTSLQAQRRRRKALEARNFFQGLAGRERQVLLQVAAGRTNREIAAALHISTGTVELHVSHILSKLGCETRTQAADYASARGRVKPN